MKVVGTVGGNLCVIVWFIFPELKFIVLEKEKVFWRLYFYFRERIF